MYFSIIRVIMGDKLKIKLSVANRIYPLTIDPSQEEGLRLASQQINTLIKSLNRIILSGTSKMLWLCVLYKLLQVKNKIL